MLLCLAEVQDGVLEESPDAPGDESFEASGGFSFGLADTNDLANAIIDYVDDYNTRAKPFNWTWNATTPSPDSRLTCALDH